MEFADKELHKKVGFKLGIFDGGSIPEDELEKVEDILISNIDPKGNKKNTDLSELPKLKGLKSLSLKGFEITNEVLDVITKLDKIETLIFYSCVSQETIRLSIERLKTLIFDRCRLVDYSEINFPENVLMVSCGIINLSDFVQRNRIKSLSIKGTEIESAMEFKNFSALRSINLDGSTLDDENVIKELQGRMSFSYAKEGNSIR